MLMSNVHVNGDVVQFEDVDVGADGYVNGDEGVMQMLIWMWMWMCV